MLRIASVDDLKAGDLGFASIKGRVGAGVLAGQAVLDIAALLRGRRVENAGWITHAYLVTEAPGDGTAQIVEAMPAGARHLWIEDGGIGPCRSRVGPGYAYARLPGDAGLSGWQDAAAAAALAMVGTGYGFAQYFALAGLALAGGDAANSQGLLARWVGRRDPDTGFPRRAICSQLVDEALWTGGVQLFDDGRPAQYVTPGALFWRAAQLGEVYVCS